MSAPTRVRYITARIHELPALVRQYRGNERQIRHLREPSTNPRRAEALAARVLDRNVAEQSLYFGSLAGRRVAGLLSDERALIDKIDHWIVTGRSADDIKTLRRLHKRLSHQIMQLATTKESV